MFAFMVGLLMLLNVIFAYLTSAIIWVPVGIVCVVLVIVDVITLPIWLLVLFFFIPVIGYVVMFINATLIALMEEYY